VISTGSITGDSDSGSITGGRVVLVPGVLALLPEYAGLADPVAELRAACLAAVSWLVAEGGPVSVVADAQGRRVAESLLGVVSTSSTTEGRSTTEGCSTTEGPSTTEGRSTTEGPGGVLVVANGSAKRGEKAPGYLDERAFGYDATIGAALRAPDPAALGDLDVSLGEELLAGNVAGLRALSRVLTPGHRASVDYEGDPFGVQYWVVRWSCGS
jgi:hypothetical protein